MRRKIKSVCSTSALQFAAALFCVALITCCEREPQIENAKFASLIVDPKQVDVRFFWRGDDAQPFKSLGNLKNRLASKNRRLRFAMNGGMFEANNQPKGLFVENGATLVALDAKSGDGNFYLKPNGVFYITKDNRAFVVPTEDFKDNGDIGFATQSGPMLLINNEINRIFDENSANLNVRNGVCAFSDGRIAFAISRGETNFYDFAGYFKSLGCRDALYLDGFVSRAYLPEQNIEQLDGDFAVIVAVVE